MSVRSSRARCASLVLAAVLVFAALVVDDAAVAAKSKSKRVTKDNACKVLTAKQIEQVMGGEAQRGGRRRMGPDFECPWTLTANGERPAGSLRVGVAFDVPRGAYPALTNNPGFEIVEGIGDSDALYQAQTATLNLFKKRRVLKLRGVFFDATTRPIRTYDPRNELIELAKLADERL